MPLIDQHCIELDVFCINEEVHEYVLSYSDYVWCNDTRHIVKKNIEVYHGAEGKEVLRAIYHKENGIYAIMYEESIMVVFLENIMISRNQKITHLFSIPYGSKIKCILNELVILTCGVLEFNSEGVLKHICSHNNEVKVMNEKKDHAEYISNNIRASPTYGNISFREQNPVPGVIYVISQNRGTFACTIDDIYYKSIHDNEFYCLGEIKWMRAIGSVLVCNQCIAIGTWDNIRPMHENIRKKPMY